MLSFMFMLKISTLEFVYISESITYVLGFREQDLLSRRIDLFLHPDETEDVLAALSDATRENKHATLVYLQLLHSQPRFEPCFVTISVANNVIVGGVHPTPPEEAGDIARNARAEEVLMIAQLDEYTSDIRRGPIAINWIGTQLPRTAFLLDRFSSDCTITHCTNAALLDPETCVDQPGGFYKYVAERDETVVRSFMSRLKRSGIGADAPASVGFEHVTFTMCIGGRDLRSSPRSAHTPMNGSDEVQVSAVGSAASDGIILVVQRDS